MFAVAKDDRIEEVGDGFAAVGDGAAADYERFVVVAVGGAEGDPGEVEQVEDIAVGEFVLEGDAEDVEFADPAAGFPAICTRWP